MSTGNEQLLARIDQLERRLAELEAQPRRRPGVGAYAIVFAVAVIGILLASPPWAGAQDEKKPGDEIVCKKLTIGEAGKPRIVLTFDDRGGIIKLMNGKEQTIALVDANESGGFLRLFGHNEKRLISIGGTKDGCQLNVCDPDGNIRAYLGLDGAKEGYLSLRDSKGNNTIYAGADGDGGLVKAYAHDGKERAFFGVGAKQGDGLIMLFGADSKRRHWIGSDPGVSSHMIYGDDGVLQHEIRGGKNGAYITMFTKDGKSIVSTIGSSNDTGEGILRLNTAQGKTVAYLGSNKNGSGGLILLNTPQDSSRVVIGIDGNGVGFGEGRDGDNVVRRAMK